MQTHTDLKNENQQPLLSNNFLEDENYQVVEVKTQGAFININDLKYNAIIRRETENAVYRAITFDTFFSRKSLFCMGIGLIGGGLLAAGFITNNDSLAGPFVISGVILTSIPLTTLFYNLPNSLVTIPMTTLRHAYATVASFFSCTQNLVGKTISLQSLPENDRKIIQDELKLLDIEIVNNESLAGVKFKLTNEIDQRSVPKQKKIACVLSDALGCTLFSSLSKKHPAHKIILEYVLPETKVYKRLRK